MTDPTNDLVPLVAATKEIRDATGVPITYRALRDAAVNGKIPAIQNRANIRWYVSRSDFATIAERLGGRFVAASPAPKADPAPPPPQPRPPAAPARRAAPPAPPARTSPAPKPTRRKAASAPATA